MVVELLTVKSPPRCRSDAVAPVKLVPVIVTEVPPGGPEVGLTPVTVGGRGRRRCNWSAALVALVPPAVVTVTSTVRVPAGPVAVMRVGAR